MQNDQIDFLAIGDIVTDAFIRVTDAEVKSDADGSNPKLCFRYGDKVPYESMEEVRAVGNSANAAVAAARLGLKSSLLAHVGNDVQGQYCLDELKKNNVATDLIGIHDGIPTNYHYVLWYDVERTILVKHATFPVQMPIIPLAPKMLYLSSLGDHTEAYHHEIATFIKEHPEMKVVFQPGTFQMKLGTGVLKDIYANTYAFFCNLEEAQMITNSDTKEIKTLIKALHDLGPKLVFITDGIKGAYASDGTEAWFMPIYPHDPYERTGAGDAFASTVSVALLQGKTIAEALRWGPINSMSVVQFVGAQKGLLTTEAVQQYLMNAPADYQPRLLM
ncbi:MAG: carbohydrate kinase family protein [Candidatus Paceibacterota bacterium]